ncbi:pyridoxine 5'-phosphate synthase [Microvirga pudoricolor]|uniref:pyridoxine 5'-phosphate synthase n=1 Tax=Microvirga pudoricolor TaxID=2778729 RepID=UPI001950302A|nr:pyridoxine 5'-phosphate synthase [Microvirga pudoricolor]MBM6595371.1 pyridoxine 5'-phosphate synthase [Microvirga pudoricolor]
MARLSVNLNKIALLRNSRRTGVPDLLPFVSVARDAGAQGITLHPRPDERHIRRTDVTAISRLMAPWRPGFELNLEGYPDERFLDIVREVRPEQCTLVPDAPGVLTSDKGWDLDPQQKALVQSALQTLKGIGCRVILFIDPDPSIPERVADIQADGVEIYTGSYAEAFRRGNYTEALEAYAVTGQRAAERGLTLNVGHDLNLHNLPPLVTALPDLAEASIGHELTADALMLGFEEAVRRYAAALARRSADVSNTGEFSPAAPG